MKRKLRLVAFVGTILTGLVALGIYLANHDIAVLQPKGSIANQQRNLIWFTIGLMFVVAVPVFLLTIGIAWRYRASNSKAKYMPEWDHSRKLETLWWGLPTIIIVILAVVAWKSSHDLDPFKAIASDRKPLTIQVVALQWKWLFIYPEQGVATVNHVEFPEDTPLHFILTADAPMNSFWIPELGGQIYAMAGMSTQLQLMADAPGSFRGSSANLSGKGFASMNFTAHAQTAADFTKWLADTKASGSVLSAQVYDELAKPSEKNAPLSYGKSEPGLYDRVIMKYMPQMVDESGMHEGAHHH